MKTEHVKPQTAEAAAGAVLDTFSKAYFKHIDSQLQQEPLWHMKDAELTCSILSTEVNYTAPKIQSPFKTNSPLFNLMEHSEHDSSDEINLCDRYEEVTAHLKVSHFFNERSIIILPCLCGGITLHDTLYMSPGFLKIINLSIFH